MKRFYLLRLLMPLLLLPVAAKADNVAQIGTTPYESLAEAVAAANDGETVTLLRDCAGDGVKVPQGKFTTGLTIDFAGYTFTMDGELVGSTGTKTQAFQLLKNNTITFQNGTIYSEKAKMLIQNYSNLTLDNMTLTLDNSDYAYAYTLSNNNGEVVIDHTTINANPAGGFAFDVCRYASYPSVSVTVRNGSEINGNVEVSASSNDPRDGFELHLIDGTLSGDIVIDASASAAMAASPEKVVIAKNNEFAQDAPDGYRWVDNGNGISELEIIPLTVKQAAIDSMENPAVAYYTPTGAQIDKPVKGIYLVKYADNTIKKVVF